MKIVFLDRDGVINEYLASGYVTGWDKFHFLPGAIEAIKLLNSNGYEPVVISNQAGVNKGLYSTQTLAQITGNMSRAIEKAGGRLKAVYYCPHREEENCDCRKPETGLFKKAIEELSLNLDLANTYFIGDSLKDVKAGRALGCRTVLVLSGEASKADVEAAGKKEELSPDWVAENLLSAVKYIINSNQKPVTSNQ